MIEFTLVVSALVAGYTLGRWHAFVDMTKIMKKYTKGEA